MYNKQINNGRADRDAVWTTIYNGRADREAVCTTINNTAVYVKHLAWDTNMQHEHIEGIDVRHLYKGTLDSALVR